MSTSLPNSTPSVAHGIYLPLLAYMLHEKLYCSSGTSKEGGVSWKDAWPCPLDTHQLCYLKHNSVIFASIVLDTALTLCDLPSVLVLPLGYEVVCQLVTQASVTWINWSDGSRLTRTLHLTLVHHTLAWYHTQMAAGQWYCSMNHLSYLS